MVEGTPFSIGEPAICTDGACGRVSQIVIDPLDQTATHLIIEPDHREGLGRLVPLDLVEGGPDGVRLRCSKAEVEALDRAERTRFLPGAEGYPGYDPEQVLLWPYFGGNTTVPVTVDTLPLGEVAVRRGQQVHAADGHVGQVRGLVVDPRNRHVSHLLLEEGHLWGHKEVAIPIAAVSAVDDDGVRLAITNEQVQDLPALERGSAG
jgi:sporulation protein YlmC with PRC-barrel domain